MANANITLGRKLTIVAQGDSISHGYVSGGNTDTLATNGTRWLDQVALRLSGGGIYQRRCNYLTTTYQSRYFGSDAPYTTLFDTSMGGMWSDRYTPADSTPTLPSASSVGSPSGFFPDIHFIQYGTNDANNSMISATYETNIRNRIADYPDAGLVVLILAWKKSDFNGTQNSRWTEYQTKLTTIAGEASNRMYLKLPEEQRTSAMVSDTTMHLTQAGNDFWANFILSNLAGRVN